MDLSSLLAFFQLDFPDQMEELLAVIRNSHARPGTKPWIDLNDAVEAWESSPAPVTTPADGLITRTINIKIWFGLIKAQLFADIGEPVYAYDELNDAVAYMDTVNASRSTAGTYQHLIGMATRLVRQAGELARDSGSVAQTTYTEPTKRHPTKTPTSAN